MKKYENFDIPPISRMRNTEKLKKMTPGEYRIFANRTKAESFRILAWKYGRKPVMRTFDEEIRIYITE